MSDLTKAIQAITNNDGQKLKDLLQMKGIISPWEDLGEYEQSQIVDSAFIDFALMSEDIMSTVMSDFFTEVEQAITNNDGKKLKGLLQMYGIIAPSEDSNSFVEENGDLWNDLGGYEKSQIYESAIRSEDIRHIHFFIDISDAQTRMNIMDYSIGRNELDIVRRLLKDGCNPNFCKKHRPFLHKLSTTKCVDMVSLLLSYGADADIRDSDGETPIFDAVYCRNVDMCKVLLNNRAMVNIQNNNGNTPLHRVGYGSFEITKLLLNAGCCINTPNKHSRFPLVSIGGCHETFIYLIQNGSYVNNVFSDDSYNTRKIYFPRRLRIDFRILKMALRAGLKVNEEEWDVEEKWDIEESDKVEIRKQHQIDQLQLRYWCRLSIRNHLIEVGKGRTIYPRIERLPIPSSIKSYLKLES